MRFAEPAVPYTQQAAIKTQTLLAEWQANCMQQQEPWRGLHWRDELQHQLSQQQGENVLSQISSLEYGK